MIYLEIFPADYGDCFLFSFKDKNNKETNILIDGGTTNTFDYFSEKLKSIDVLDLIVVTHIDEDHINGIKKLLNENQKLINPKIVKVKELWFNGFKHIHLNKVIKAKYTEKEKEQLKLFEVKDSGRKDFQDIALKESINLTKTIYDLGYDNIWNTTFGKGPVVLEKGNRPIIVNDSIKIYLLTPTQKDLDKLDEYCLKKFKEKVSPNTQIKDDEHAIEFVWENILIKEKPKKKNIKNISLTDLDIDKLINTKFVEDDSKSNKSSISFILECSLENKTIKILFLGDSFCTDVIKSLDELNKQNYELKFNAIKVSHHGSNGNTSPKLLEMIESDYFIISTNGEKHKHPDLETILWILNSNKDKPIKFIFNYHTEISKKMNLSDIKEKFQNFEIIEVNLQKSEKENSYLLKF